MLSGKMGKYRTSMNLKSLFVFCRDYFPNLSPLHFFFCLHFKFTPIASVDWIVNDLLHYYDHREETQCPHSREERGPHICCSFLIVGQLAIGKAISHHDLQTCHTRYFDCMLSLKEAFKYMYMSGNIYILLYRFQICNTKYRIAKKQSVLFFCLQSA